MGFPRDIAGSGKHHLARLAELLDGNVDRGTQLTHRLEPGFLEASHKSVQNLQGRSQSFGERARPSDELSRERTLFTRLARSGGRLRQDRVKAPPVGGERPASWLAGPNGP